jgi:hypothetical protein
MEFITKSYVNAYCHYYVVGALENYFFSIHIDEVYITLTYFLFRGRIICETWYKDTFV